MENKQKNKGIIKLFVKDLEEFGSIPPLKDYSIFPDSRPTLLPLLKKEREEAERTLDYWTDDNIERLVNSSIELKFDIICEWSCFPAERVEGCALEFSLLLKEELGNIDREVERNEKVIGLDGLSSGRIFLRRALEYYKDRVEELQGQWEKLAEEVTNESEKDESVFLNSKAGDLLVIKKDMGDGSYLETCIEVLSNERIVGNEQDEESTSLYDLLHILEGFEILKEAYPEFVERWLNNRG